MGNNLDQFVSEYNRFGGILDGKNSILSDKISNISKQKTSLDEYLQDLEDRYLQRFIAMDQTITRLNSTKSYLEETFNALNKSNDWIWKIN
mgnify:CR=1 FL=1